jgi:hypothetical protein
VCLFNENKFKLCFDQHLQTSTTLLVVFMFHRARAVATERKTVNAEFYKGVLDRLLKRMRQVHPTVFCS